MLLHLHVKNLALIEEIEVDFGQGLNILTGETGAGKSILMGSIQLILGGKVSRDMVRDNTGYALVEALFQVEDEKARKTIEGMEIELEDGQILLSRRIKDGRSINKINGSTCTLAEMKAVSACLLDIHGQHEHQSLLYPEKQLKILDSFGRKVILPVKERTALAYKEWRNCLKALKSFDLDPESRKREMAFLSFEVNEIQEAALVPGEDENLEKLYRKLANARRIAQTLEEVHGLTGYDSAKGAGEQVGEALRELSRITEYDEALEELESSLVDLESLLGDFNRELSLYMDSLTFDEEAFFETEKRLDLINNLKAKYGQSIEQILAYEKEQQKKLEAFESYEENLKKARIREKKAREALEKVCGELTELRRQQAQKLNALIIEGLNDLNFNNVSFDIRFDRDKNYTPEGVDVVEYVIATNPGENMKPLAQIVSGGELSRIMLALKAILADRDQIETLIFDEIDTGISGRTAQKVSEKMAAIGTHHQLLCITHLPQIASMADVHFEIEKHMEGNRTITEIHTLSEEESIRELARLLGGASITPAVLENAAEMKKLAARQKSLCRICPCMQLEEDE